MLRFLPRLKGRLEILVTHALPSSKSAASVLVGAAVIALALWQFNWVGPAGAAPSFASAFGSHASMLEPVRIYRRGRPPIYPYVYTRRPGGWSTYFGFVPYEKGDFEIQALQRFYPQTNWPPSMRTWTPQSGF
jgi:hypothetical protein